MTGDRVQRAIVAFCIIATITVGMLLFAEIAAFLTFRVHPLVSSIIRLAAGRTEAAAASTGVVGTAYQGQSWAKDFLREQDRVTTDYEPYVVWRGVPFHGNFIVVGSDHLRQTLHSICRTGAYTIWLFGGSTMWGFGSPDWGTIPSWLADDYTRAGRQVCVRNYGQIGWVNTQEVIELSLELARTARKPDLVLFYDGVNEVGVPSQTGHIGIPDQHDLIKRELESADGLRAGEKPFGYLAQTNAVRLLQRLLMRVGLGQRNSKPYITSEDLDRLAPAILTNYRENMRFVEVLARGYGFKCAFFWQPALLAGAKPLTAEELEIERRNGLRWPMMRELYAKTYPLARNAARPPLFYIADVFDDQQTTLFSDPYHVGPKGNRIVADRIYDVLKAEGF